MRSVVAINRFPPNPGQVDLLEQRAMLAGLPVERMPEAGLCRLFHRPPHGRLAAECDQVRDAADLALSSPGC